MRRLLAALRAVDVALGAVVAGVGLASFFARAALCLGRRGGTAALSGNAARPRIMYLGTGSLDQVGPRNGVGLFLRGECSDFEGYFEHVYNVSFPTAQRKTWRLDERRVLEDYDLPAALALQRLGLRALSVALREVAFLHWALSFARRNRVSILEATNPYLQGANAYLLSRALGLPYAVLITRDYDFDYRALGKLAFPSVFPWRRVEKLVERWVLGHADLVLADRAHYLRYGLANGARPARSFQSRVVVDEAYYADPATRPNPRAALGLAGGRLLLHVGRLQPDKLPGVALECLALVRQRGHDARLAFAGDGELRAELAEQARRLGVAEHVHFLGSQPLQVLPGLMSAADVILGANMGYTLVEAALSGRPVVTCDYDWHPEVVQHGRTGVLVPLGDVQAMADWTARLLAEPELADALGRAARQDALERHGHAAMVREYQRAYDSVLGGRDSAASAGQAASPSAG